MVTNPMETWDISARGEKRFTEGHPWVFSNEILSPIKKIQPGDLVQLMSPKGRLLAVGYGNPHSLIAFRTLERESVTINDDWFIKKLIAAARFRQKTQLSKYSHRMVFSEADDLPGLIIDCFKTPHTQQIFVIEILTAGIEKLLPQPQKVITQFLHVCEKEGLNYFAPSRTTFVVKRDSSFRRLENLALMDTEVYGEMTHEQLQDMGITIAAAHNGRDYILSSTNLVSGQKTGFFLDQRTNIELLLHHLPQFDNKTVRTLDLFCYVGQWSQQLTHYLQSEGYDVEPHAVDASEKALNFAKKNLSWAANAHLEKMDIVEKCGELKRDFYDVVICDPPALIKSKKDFDAGRHAYIKVNAAALRALKPGGIFVSCSCSQHLNEQDLIDVLTHAATKAEKSIKWIARGQQGPDHPMLLEFPQGTYLNSWIGVAKINS